MPSSKPPFARLSREILVANAWHRYCRDEYVQTDGSTGEYFYIDMIGACAIVPQFANGDLLLIECERYLLGKTLWEFPIGGIEPGDSPLAAAQKELQQESGYTANDWVRLGGFAPYKGVSNEITHVFLARDLEPCGQDLEPSESIRVHRLPPEEAERRIYGQELPDGQTMAAWTLWQRDRHRP